MSTRFRTASRCTLDSIVGPPPVQVLMRKKTWYGVPFADDGSGMDKVVVKVPGLLVFPPQ